MINILFHLSLLCLQGPKSYIIPVILISTTCLKLIVGVLSPYQSLEINPQYIIYGTVGIPIRK